ncbi:MAG: DUF1080 domain-containing protein [Phycisphaerae bacterium]|nr:DUF1080 domain-containing protein [Phycisphaerae bacterium]
MTRRPLSPIERAPGGRMARSFVALCAALLAASFGAASADARDQVIRPFEGRTLDGWDGDRSFWLVEDGAIVGRSTRERPVPHSQYLAWTGTMPDDFELRCQVRLVGGNSGIQYRSRRVPGHADMAGFQADLDAANAYTGALYEGHGRGLMSARGEQVEWTPEGKRVLARFGSEAALRAVIRDGEWNDYRIEAIGTRVRHWINGALMSDVSDGDASRFRRGGALALQLHSGDPMEVRFRNLEVRRISSAPPASAISAPEGFTVELLASAGPGQGSWVCLCFDAKGRAIVSPQNGPLLRAWIPGVSRRHDGSAWPGRDTEFTPLDADAPGSAHGLCVLGDDLFVNCAQDEQRRGLWRLRDRDGDGEIDERTKLFAYSNDGGEHGPHGVIPGPDGALWMTIGNHTRVPDGIVRGEPDADGRRAPGSPADFWAEDIPVPRIWDPNGHAVGLTAPGGVILRIDPETGAATIFAMGLRNAYDLCFDADGELLTYDSDMEWDIGAPWYRAPRIVHVVSGGEYGWRSGSGKWPEWYPDSLPSACDTDVSSPTGMLAGADGGFPPPWNELIFAADWTYGRVLAIDPQPLVSAIRETGRLQASDPASMGAGIRATWMPFLSGRPMPVTDMAWGPDGAMYMITGGRGTQSGLYRIRATADAGRPVHESVADSPKVTQEKVWIRDIGMFTHEKRVKRRELEAWHRPLPSAEFDAAFPTIVEALGSGDRTLAYAARVALEHQPIESWRDRVMDLPAGDARLLGALALARRGKDADAQRACEIASAALSESVPSEIARTRLAAPRDEHAVVERLILALRAAQVALLRHPGLADSEPLQACGAAAVTLGSDLSIDPRVAQAALELACALQLPGAIEPCVNRLDAATDRADALRWAAMVRTLKDGWTEPLRERYWRWLDAADAQSGGMSLGGFIVAIRSDAQQHVKRPASSPTPPPRGAPSAVPPPPSASARAVRAWNVADLLDESISSGRDLARGARIYREASCMLCHRFNGDGVATGPDLTGVASRFGRADLLRAILEPSADVSDQYRDSMVTTHDGEVVVGRVVADLPEYLEIRTNPMGFERERLQRASIASIEPISTSVMPPGLLDSRTREEILDLLAYLESGAASAPPR